MKNYKDQSWLKSAIERNESGDILGFDLQNEVPTVGGCNLEAEIDTFNLPLSFFCSHEWDFATIHSFPQHCKKCGLSVEEFNRRRLQNDR